MMQRCFICLLLLLTISGCAHRGSFTPPPDLVAHQQQLQRITHWELNGKLGIRTPDESGSASLKWAQQLADYQINLSGPLGQKRMIITGTPAGVGYARTPPVWMVPGDVCEIEIEGVGVLSNTIVQEV